MKRKRLKKRRNRLRFKKKLVLTSTLVLFLVIGIGFSALSVDLNILGNITVRKHYDDTLFDAFEKEAAISGLAREYTGDHHDSFTEEPTEKIYYWYAPNSTAANLILNKNNVIFADHCWQMIRTTDTGGVKLVYNGEVENDQCLDTRGTHVGYDSIDTQSMSINYYYGTSYNYDKTNNVFSLDGTVTTGAINVGQYTCKSTSSSGTCSTLYLVDKLMKDTTYYSIPLTSNSHYSQFGKLQYNNDYNSPAAVGYMYNKKYKDDFIFKTSSETIYSTATLSTSYWYAHDMVWGTPIANKYNLVNPYQISSTSDYPSLAGEYTLKYDLNSASNYSYYIAGVNGNTMYTINMVEGNDLAYYNDTYTYGDSYIDNGNGTYTIKNQDESVPITIHKSDWYTNYSNIGANKYMCKNAVNNTCSELWYTIETLNKSVQYVIVSNVYKFAKGFNYNSSTNTYTLNNESVSFWNTNDDTNLQSLNNAHYTCWNETGTCDTISYIYYNYSGGLLNYIELSNGEGVEDALEEMLSADNVNTFNSTIKTGVDAWYQRYMIEYTPQLEDVVFCNNRNIRYYGGWDPNGGNLGVDLHFKNFNGDVDFSCTNITDRFSLANDKARLTYPVGLLTYSDVRALSNVNLRKTGQYYWLIAPYKYPGSGVTYGVSIDNTGSIKDVKLNGILGVRPVVSLRANTEFDSGDGSKENPYVVAVST